MIQAGAADVEGSSWVGPRRYTISRHDTLVLNVWLASVLLGGGGAAIRVLRQIKTILLQRCPPLSRVFRRFRVYVYTLYTCLSPSHHYSRLFKGWQKHIPASPPKFRLLVSLSYDGYIMQLTFVVFRHMSAETETQVAHENRQAD